MSDDERAALELIVEAPRKYLPPLVRPATKRLAARGLIVQVAGAWTATKAGVTATRPVPHAGRGNRAQ
jgi:hypothetical protein